MSGLRLLIGNRRYSSWSLRGWLALKHSGLAFTTERILLDGPEFVAAKASGRLPAGRVPVLWDDRGEVAVWDSLAILQRCAEQPGVPAFWPVEPRARSFAWSIVAEMHSGFAALREACPMELLRGPERIPLAAKTTTDLGRVEAIWTEARTRFGAGGPWLFGAFGAADIMYAPVAARVHGYALPVGPVAGDYVASVMAHAWLREWIEAIADEPVIPAEMITAFGPWRSPVDSHAA